LPAFSCKRRYFCPSCHQKRVVEFGEWLCSDGCFYGRGGFRLAPKFHLRDLEALFRHKVLRMLLARGKINRELIRMMEGWRHSGFNVYAEPRIHPWEKRSLENLAAYLIRSSFSQQRMEYRADQAKVTYYSKDRREKKS